MQYMIVGGEVYSWIHQRDELKTELFHARLFVLDETLAFKSIRLSPGMDQSSAMQQLAATLDSGKVPGGVILSDRLLASDPRDYRHWRPGRNETVTSGQVVGHVAVFTPAEPMTRYMGRSRGREAFGVHPPQIIQIVSVLVWDETHQRHRTVHARLYQPGKKPLPRKKKPSLETYYCWKDLTALFPLDTKVNVAPRDGYYLLDEPLPEDNKVPASVEDLTRLKDHWSAAGASAK